MRTQQGREEAKKDYEQFDSQIRDTRFWIQNKIMGIEDRNLYARLEKGNTLLEGLLEEYKEALEHNYHYALCLMASSMWKWACRNGESLVVQPEVESEGRDFRDLYRLWKEAQRKSDDVRHEVKRLRQTVAYSEQENRESDLCPKY